MSHSPQGCLPVSLPDVDTQIFPLLKADQLAVRIIVRILKLRHVGMVTMNSGDCAGWIRLIPAEETLRPPQTQL